MTAALRIAVIVLTLWPRMAWAEGTSESVPIEIQWLKVAAEVISTVGMPGVIAGLLYLLRFQRNEHAAERTEFQTALKEEQAYNRKLQEERIAATSASADRMATVAVSSANAITTAAEKNAGVQALCNDIKDAVQPLEDLDRRILGNQDELFKSINAVALKVGNGCRAP